MTKKTVSCEIVRSIGVLSTSNGGWSKELNEVTWNGAPPKLDLRDWSPDHQKSGKGNTLTTDEAMVLIDLLKKELGL